MLKSLTTIDWKGMQCHREEAKWDIYLLHHLAKADQDVKT
jgi:hypothetical protein